MLSEDEALELMIRQPLLIRRPLMRVGEEYRVGFETGWVHEWIGLAETTISQDLETCPRKIGRENRPSM